VLRRRFDWNGLTIDAKAIALPLHDNTHPEYDP
jgi:hypothetical protein